MPLSLSLDIYIYIYIQICVCIYIYIYTHTYITLHYITLHYITLHIYMHVFPYERDAQVRPGPLLLRGQSGRGSGARGFWPPEPTLLPGCLPVCGGGRPTGS